MFQSQVERRALLGGVVAFLGGAAAGSAAGCKAGMASVSQPGAADLKMLRGTVIANPAPTGTQVSVQIDGGVVETLSYLAPYVPVPGDVVSVSSLSSGDNTTRVVLGGFSGRAGNLVVNGDFHRIPQLKEAKPPMMWAHHRAAGSRTQVVAALSPLHEKPVMVFSSYPDRSGDNIAYSAAFPVGPGETIKADASMTCTIIPPMSVDVDLRIAWFADLAGTYPKVLKEDVLMGRLFDVNGESLLEGSAKVPAGATAARVAVRAKHSAPDAAQYTLFISHVYAAR